MNYSVQHVLIMRLLMQYPLKNSRSLHILLYLAAADDLKRYELAFYDFVRLETGPYSPIVQTIIDELIYNKLANPKDLELTPLGREMYYSLSAALRGFDDFVNKCNDIVLRNKNNHSLVNSSIRRNLLLRKTPIGSKIFKI